MTLLITGLPVVQQGRKTVGSGVVQLISCGGWWLMINWREGACRFSYFRKLRGGGGNKWKYLLKSELLAILFVMKWSARNNIYKQISILKFLSTCLVLLQVKQCMKYYTANSSINIYEPSLKLNHEIFDIIDHRK